MKCHFSTDTLNILSCSRKNSFDDNGIPEESCSLFPCAKYKSIVLGLEKEEYVLNFCKKCYQMTNHNLKGECLKCKREEK
jgi:hypothetical protein